MGMQGVGVLSLDAQTVRQVIHWQNRLLFFWKAMLRYNKLVNMYLGCFWVLEKGPLKIVQTE